MMCLSNEGIYSDARILAALSGLDLEDTQSWQEEASDEHLQILGEFMQGNSDDLGAIAAQVTLAVAAADIQHTIDADGATYVRQGDVANWLFKEFGERSVPLPWRQFVAGLSKYPSPRVAGTENAVESPNDYGTDQAKADNETRLMMLIREGREYWWGGLDTETQYRGDQEEIREWFKKRGVDATDAAAFAKAIAPAWALKGGRRDNKTRAPKRDNS